MGIPQGADVKSGPSRHVAASQAGAQRWMLLWHLGEVNEGTVSSGAIFHIRRDYKLGYVGHSTPVFNHTQHHISAHMPMV